EMHRLAVAPVHLELARHRLLLHEHRPANGARDVELVRGSPRHSDRHAATLVPFERAGKRARTPPHALAPSAPAPRAHPSGPSAPPLARFSSWASRSKTRLMVSSRARRPRALALGLASLLAPFAGDALAQSSPAPPATPAPPSTPTAPSAPAPAPQNPPGAESA